MKKRNLLKTTLALAATTLFSAAAWSQSGEIKVGVTAGPHAQILEAVKVAAKKNGLNIKIVEFSDFIQPNAALASGELQANAYQHAPYFTQQIKDRGYALSAVGNTVILPIALYSKKIKSLDALKSGAQIGVPNDPTNGGRALLLLQQQGLIKLKPGVDIKATPLDIVENPKKLRIRELDAAQLVHALNDLDGAVINTSYAIAAKLNPTKDSIARESTESPYTNLIAVQTKEKDKPWVKELVKAYQSEEVRKFVESEFQGSIVPAF